MARFPGINKEAWAPWCYTMLDKEHKDELIEYAKTLGLIFTKNDSKIRNLSCNHRQQTEVRFG